MKLTCLQENLNIALTKVYRAIPNKSELPILSNVLITAEDNVLSISATNLSTTIVTKIGASIDKDGTITIPAKIFKDLVSSLSPGTIELSLDDNVLNLKAEHTESKLNGVSSEDYPDLPTISDKTKPIELNSKEFSKTVNLVSYAAAIDDSRPIFTGIYLDFNLDTLTIAASDGFRLSQVKMEIPEHKDKFSIVIPAKTLTDVVRVFNSDQPLEFALDKNSNLAIFKQDDTFIATRMIDGAYPDYEKIVPTKGKYKVTFDAVKFLEAVKLTNIFAKESDNAVSIKLNPKKKKIEFSSNAQEMGEHLGEIEAEVEIPDKVEIEFNSKYLIDFLNNTKVETITMTSAGNITPCKFTATEFKNFFHIIMPIQRNRAS